MARRVTCALIVISCAVASLAHADPPEEGNPITQASTQAAAQASTQPQPTTRSTRRRFSAIPTSAPAVGTPIPGLLVQEQILGKIREIYATDYTDTSFTARRALSQRLMLASDETKRDSDAKFVLLREARDVATNAGDVGTAFDAVDRMVTAFPLIKLHERIGVLRKAIPVLSSPQANLAATSICMDLFDQCMIEGDYDRAEELLALAKDTVRAAKSRPYAAWIEAREASLRPLKAAWDVARPAHQALIRNANDPDANLEYGKFVTFIKRDFDAGLTMLAKGSDSALAHVADQDLDTPTDHPMDQLKIGSAWWELCESKPPEYRSAIRARAGYWYRMCVASLDGLDKALVQRRLQQISPPPKRGAAKGFTRPPDALLLTTHWYRASVAEVSWETAQRLCQDSGGQLACIETRTEGDLLTKLARGKGLWLGASLDAETSKWTWLSGADFFFNNWAWGEPAILTPESHPLTGPSGAWKTSTGKCGFICEWSE